MSQRNPAPGPTPTDQDASLLADVEHLQLVARLLVQGALAGVHRSARRGSSIEFSEHKLYTPGDDIRHIDWRAYAKSDRYHVKQFEDETNLRVELMLDRSGSMAFSAGGRQSKLDYARSLASALCYLALRQGDAAGLTVFAEDATDTVPAQSSSGHLTELLRRLAAVRAEGGTSVAAAMDYAARVGRRRSVCVVLTDLLDPDPELYAAFRRLAARHHDISVVHLLDPAEVDFPYDNPALFASMEDSRRLFVHPRTLRNAYVAEMRRFLDDTARAMAEARIHYFAARTDEPPATLLGAFLRERQGWR